MHSHYHHNYHHYLVFSLAVTRIFKIILTSPDHNSITNALSPLPHHWHSLYNSLITDNHAWRNKLYNARNWQGKVHKTERMKSTSVCHSDTNLQKFCLLEGNLCRHSADKAVTWKIPGSKSRTGSVSLTASRLVSTGLLPLGQSGRVVNLTNHLYPFPNLWCTIQSSRRYYVAVIWAGAAEFCESVWNWDVRQRVGWLQCRLVQRSLWRLVSFGIWCELLGVWSVGLPELWRWRQ